MSLLSDFAPGPSLLRSFTPETDTSVAADLVKQTVNPHENYFSQGLRSAFMGQGAGDLFQEALDAESKGDRVGAMILKHRAEQLQQEANLERGAVPTWEQASNLTQGLRPLTQYAMSGMGQGAGSMLPSIAAAAITPFGPLAKTVAAAIPAYGMNRGEQVGKQYADPEQAILPVDVRQSNASKYAATASVPDAIVPGAIGARMFGKKVGGALDSAAGTMGWEGATEAIQNRMSDYAQKQLNPEHQYDSAEDMENFRQGVLGGAFGHALTLPGQAIGAAGEASLTAGKDLFGKIQESNAVKSLADSYAKNGIVGVATDALGSAADNIGVFAANVRAMHNVAKVYGWTPIIKDQIDELSGQNKFINRLVASFGTLGATTNKVLFGKDGSAQTLMSNLAKTPERMQGLIAGMNTAQKDAAAIEAAQYVLGKFPPHSDANKAAQAVMEQKNPSKEDLQVVLAAHAIYKTGVEDLDSSKAFDDAANAAELRAKDPVTARAELANRMRDAINSAIHINDSIEGSKDVSDKLIDLSNIQDDQELTGQYMTAKELVRGVEGRAKAGSELEALKGHINKINEARKNAGITEAFSKLTGANIKGGLEGDDLAVAVYEALSKNADKTGLSEEQINDAVKTIVGYYNGNNAALLAKAGNEKGGVLSSMSDFERSVNYLTGGKKKYTSEIYKAVFKKVAGGNPTAVRLSDAVLNVLGERGNIEGQTKKGDTEHQKVLTDAIEATRLMYAPQHTSAFESPMQTAVKKREQQRVYEEMVQKISNHTGTKPDIVRTALLLRANPMHHQAKIKAGLLNPAANVEGNSTDSSVTVAMMKDVLPREADDEGYGGQDGTLNLVGQDEAGLSYDAEATPYESKPLSPVNTEQFRNPGGEFIAELKKLRAMLEGSHNISTVTMNDWASSKLPWGERGNIHSRNRMLQDHMDNILADDAKRLSELTTRYGDLKVSIATLQLKMQEAWEMYDEANAENKILDSDVWKDYFSARERHRTYVKSVTEQTARELLESSDTGDLPLIAEEIYWMNARKGTASKSYNTPSRFFETYDQYRVIVATPKTAGLEQLDQSDFEKVSTAYMPNNTDLLNEWLMSDDDNAPMPEKESSDIPKGSILVGTGEDAFTLDIAALLAKQFRGSNGVTKEDVLRELTGLYFSLTATDSDGNKIYGELPIETERILLDGRDLRLAVSQNPSVANKKALAAFVKEQSDFPLLRSEDGKVNITLGDFLKEETKDGFAAIDFKNAPDIVLKDPYAVAIKRAKQARVNAELARDQAAVDKANRDLAYLEKDRAGEITTAKEMKQGILRMTGAGGEVFIHMPNLIAASLANRGFNGNMSQLSKATQMGLFMKAMEHLTGKRKYKLVGMQMESVPGLQNKLRNLVVSEGAAVRGGIVNKGQYESSVTYGDLVDAFALSGKKRISDWASTDTDYVANKIGRFLYWASKLDKISEDRVEFNTPVTGDERASELERQLTALNEKIADEQSKSHTMRFAPKEEMLVWKNGLKGLLTEKQRLETRIALNNGTQKGVSQQTRAELQQFYKTNVAYLLSQELERALDNGTEADVMHLLVNGPDAQKVKALFQLRLLDEGQGGEFTQTQASQVIGDIDTTGPEWPAAVAELLRDEVEALKGLYGVSMSDVEVSRMTEMKQRQAHEAGNSKVPLEKQYETTPLKDEGDALADEGTTSPDVYGFTDGRPQQSPTLEGDAAIRETFRNQLTAFDRSLVRPKDSEEGFGAGATLEGIIAKDPEMMTDLQSVPGKLEAHIMLIDRQIARNDQPGVVANGGTLGQVVAMLKRAKSILEPLAKPFSVANPAYNELVAPTEGDVGNAQEKATPSADFSHEYNPDAYQASTGTGMGAIDTKLDPNFPPNNGHPHDELFANRAKREADPTYRYSKMNVLPPETVAHLQGSADELLAQYKKMMKNVGSAYVNTSGPVLDENGDMQPEKTSEYTVAINSALALPQMWSFMHHGAIHALLNALQRDGDDPANKKVAEKIMRVSNTKHMQAKVNAILKALGQEEEIARIEGKPDEYAAYMFQFSHLHGADGKPMLSIGEDTKSAFEMVKRFLAWIIRASTEAQQVTKFIDAWEQGKVDIGSPYAAKEGLGMTYTDTALDNLSETLKPLMEVAHKLMDSSVTRMRRMNHETVNQIADWYSGSHGKVGFEARHKIEAFKLANDLSKTMGGIDSKATRDALAELLSGREVTSDAGKKLQKWMKDNGMYTQDRPEVIWNMDVINDNPEAFLYDVKERGWAKPRTLTDADRETANTIVNALINANMTYAGDVKTMHDINSIEGMYGIEVRDIAPGHWGDLSKYMEHDPTMYFPHLLMRHTKSIAHEKVFGKDLGALKEAIAKIARDPKLSSAQKAEVGDYISMMEGRLGASMTPAMRTAQNWALTATNIVTLPLAMFSQLVEPMTVAARSGNLGDAFSAMGTGLAGIPAGLFGTPIEDHEHQLAEEIGAIERDSAIDNMQFLQNGVHMSGMPHKISKMFFKYNGMEGWHRSQHAAAAGAAERFIIAHKSGEGESGRFLADVGLTPEDIKIDEHGHLARDENGKVPEKIANAIHLFMHQALAIPSKSNTAIWMNDPRFAILAHMKRFTFAFHEDVLRRAFDEYKNHKNGVPLSLLMGAIPVALAAGGMKHLLKGVDVGWDQAMMGAVQNSSLMGKWEFIYRAMQDVGFGHPAGFSMLGPVIGTASDVASGRGI
jgi:hypothetical protein